jgi:hypothetical protein
MARGASSHFSLKRAEYDRYYPTVLGVLQNSGFLVLDADRDENRAFLQGLPRSGVGPGIEIEVRRRPKGIDIHVLVVPHEDLPQEKGRFLMRQGVFGSLQSDPASERTLAGILPGLRRDGMERQVDPRFRRTPTNIPEWIFFNLKTGTVTWFLGTVIGLTSAAYLLFWAPEGPYRQNGPLMTGLLLVLAPWWSGIWGRSALRGLIAAFVTVSLPVTFYVVSALGWAFPGLTRPPGISLIQVLLASIQGPAGIAVPVILGILSGIVGAIAGVIGGRIFPLRVKRSAESI